MRKENQKYKVEREEADRVMNEALEKVRKDLTESNTRLVMQSMKEVEEVEAGRNIVDQENAGRSLMTAALSTRQRPSDSGVVMRHHKGASAEGGRGSADRSTEEEGLPASTEELASADTSRPLEAIVEEKESQLGLTEKGVIRSQGEGEDKPENMEETETNQAKVKKKIVSFCQKVNAGARAFKERFKVIFKNNGGGGVL